MNTLTIFNAYVATSRQSHEAGVRIAGGVGWMPLDDLAALSRFMYRRERQIATFEPALRARIAAQTQSVATLTCALEHVAVEMFRTSMPDLCEMACAVEGIVRIVDPAFRLAAESMIDESVNEESALYAQALRVCDCPPATSVGVEGASGWQSR